ncbi:MAG: hypothetical protein MI810_11275 [Flavobacteriales bacterium]|nr:hypothetical protein [Flavobacteriales bacterium]
MRHLILLIVTSFTLWSYGQFVPSVGTKLYHIKAGDNYQKYRVAWYNEMDTYDFYTAHNHLNPMGVGINVRSFGGRFLDSSKFKLGYSLELGFQQFRSKTNFIYEGSSSAHPDSALNAKEGFTFYSDYTTVYFTHYLDFNWNLTTKLKWTNSIGVGLAAMFRSTARDFPFREASFIDNDRPVILTTNFESQITEKYKRFDVGYFVSLGLFSFPLFNDDDPEVDQIDNRTKLSEVRFNAIGIRIIPHPRLKKKVELGPEDL